MIWTKLKKFGRMTGIPTFTDTKYEVRKNGGYR